MQIPSNGTVILNHPISLSRFDLIRTLGQGAVGAVYLVRDREMDSREVALKILIGEIDLDDNTKERFRQEIDLLMSLNHRNIVKAYDCIETDQYIAYTMEYVDGSDLSTIYDDHNLGSVEIKSIIVQLLSALGALHEKKVWHRDIKLENVMLTPDNEVKLTDLGLVKNPSNVAYTKTGVLLGTAQYMPPEYIKDAKFDGRGDIYAVGVMLFELLAKRRRFPSLPGNKIVEKLIECNFKIPDQEMISLPAKYVAIIKKAVEPDIKKRFQSAEEMIEALLHKKNTTSQISRMQPTISFGQVMELKAKKDRKRRIILFSAFIIFFCSTLLFYRLN